LVAVAVNAAAVPAQKVVSGVVIDTTGAVVGLMVIVTFADVALVGEAQPKLDVITTVITSPLLRADDVYVLLLEPAFTPFTFH
jgi:hypothetical protein